MEKNLLKKINVPLLKTIVFLIGVLGVFVAGLFFVLAGDMMLTVQSLWLMVTIILSFGSAICVFLSGSFKERKQKMYILKSIAIGLAVAFLVFIVVFFQVSISKMIYKCPECGHLYEGPDAIHSLRYSPECEECGCDFRDSFDAFYKKFNDDEPSFVIKRVRYDREARIKTRDIAVATIVFGAIGLAAQVADLVFAAKLPED